MNSACPSELNALNSRLIGILTLLLGRLKPFSVAFDCVYSAFGLCAVNFASLKPCADLKSAYGAKNAKCALANAYFTIQEDKMKKLICAFFGILVATSSVAEESAWFVGGQLGYSSVTSRWTVNVGTTYRPNYQDIDTKQSAARYGILAGRKSFFTENFGLRYYVGANFGSYEGVSAFDLQVNVDAAYNFVNVGDIPIGAFVGIGTGYKSYDNPVVKKWGAIFNINLGLRTTIAEHHGIELFYTHDMAAASVSNLLIYSNFEYRKPDIFGIRYTYSF